MSKDEVDPEAPEAVARRRFLRAAAYAAPAIVSTVVVRKAHAQQTASCMPGEVCTPFDPDPCMPDLMG